MPDELPGQSADRVNPPLHSEVRTNDTQSRYVVERCGGGGGRAVYEVIDRTRMPPHRVVCRTNFADANMIAAALNESVTCA